MATIIVQPGGPRAGRQRVNLTAMAHNRLMLLLILFLAITAILIGRLFWVGVFAHGTGGDDPLGPFVPARADIVDRNGVPLARTMDAYSVSVRPSKLIGEPAELARKLHEIFPDEAEATFYKKLTGKGWAYLRRRALPEQVAAVNALGEIGIEFLSQTRTSALELPHPSRKTTWREQTPISRFAKLHNRFSVWAWRNRAR